MPTAADIVASYHADMPWLVATYKHLHQIPELSENEVETAAVIANRLAYFPDWEVHTGVGGHGVVAVLRNGDGPTVLFRADMDGLPVLETSQVDYASTQQRVNATGKLVPTMHACGHDMHVSGLLGAVEILTHTQAEWSGTVIALFQPAEEVSKGAEAMIAAQLDQLIPRPDVCLAQHVVAAPAGRVLTTAGPIMASCATLTITLHGRGAHASMPHMAIDPIVLAASIVLRLQTIVSREVPPGEFAVVTVAKLRAGEVGNIIPASAEITLNLRFYDMELKDRVVQAIRRIVAGECLASGATIEPEYRWSAVAEAVVNDARVHATVRQAFDEGFGEDSYTAKRWSASEDFVALPRHFGVPYAYWFIGVTPRNQWAAAAARGRIQEDIPVNHNGAFVPDLSALSVAVRAAATGIIACLQSPITPALRLSGPAVEEDD